MPGTVPRRPGAAVLLGLLALAACGARPGSPARDPDRTHCVLLVPAHEEGAPALASRLKLDGYDASDEGNLVSVWMTETEISTFFDVEIGRHTTGASATDGLVEVLVLPPGARVIPKHRPYVGGFFVDDPACE